MTGSLDDITVTVNEAALEARIAKLSLVAASALKVAEDIAEVARGTAPVNTGAYRDSIVAQPFKGGARVYAADYKSFWIEFGVSSRGIEATHNLRLAAVALNYQFKAFKHRG